MTTPARKRGPRARDGRRFPARVVEDLEKRTRLLSLRRRTRRAESDPIVVATLLYRLPDWVWVGRFSRAHPSVRLEFLAYSPLSRDVSVVDCWVTGRPAGVWAPEISRYPDVRHAESVAEMGGGCLYRVTFRNPPVVYLYRRLRMPLPLPIWMQGGMGRWEIVARTRAFHRLVEHFRRTVDPDLRIVSLHRSPLRSHLPQLSETQRQMLSAAMAAGYYAVPRKVSLGELARRLRRSRSALSETLAIVEEKLLESTVSNPSSWIWSRKRAEAPA